MTRPKFSVIIPTRNREVNLALLLAGLDQQTEWSFETIVVNDGSDDNTEKVAEIFSRARIITIPHSGPAIARNLGAREATGEILVFVDDDCVVPNNWLALYADAFQTEEAQAVAGSVENVLTENSYAAVYQLTTEFFQKKQNSIHGKAGFVTSNNFACLKSVFDATGGFDGRFRRGAEDRELAARLIHEGYSFVFNPRIKILHAHLFSFFSFLRHSYDHGKGSYLFARIVKEKHFPLQHLHAMEYGVFFVTLLRIKITFAFVWIVMEASHLAGYCVAAISRTKKLS